MRRHASRGQTMPLWIVATLTSLGLVLFLFNYMNTVRYAIGAQNAADSAAAAALGNDAASLNTAQTLLAALDIQELRVRDVAAAVPSLLTGSDANCSGSGTLLSANCVTDLTSAASDLTTQMNTLSTVTATLNSFSGNLTGRIANPASAVSSLFQPNGSNGCAVAVLTDCDYTYSTYVSYGANGVPTVDEYACKKETNLGGGFLHLPAANQTYYAVGRAVVTLSPLSMPLNPSSLGGALQTTSATFPSVTSANDLSSIAGIDVNSNDYLPAPGSAGPAKALTTVCPA